MKGAWKKFRTASGHDIGRKAIRVYICSGCERWHEGSKPAACEECGRMDLINFDSKTEAKDWMRLVMLQKRGKIANLRRQVRFPLLTIHERTGKPVQFGVYIADMVYDDIDAGLTGVVFDSKGGAISPEAKLKLRCMEMSGRTVKLNF
jgi:hypothetical protein